MNERNRVNESDEGSPDSTSPECKVVPVTKSPVPRANLVHALERTARCAETIRSLNRPLGISQQMAETIRALNRPLGISQQMAETMRAFNRPLGISQQMAETMRALNRPLGISQQMAETMRALNRPLGISQQMAETMRALNRPLGISQQMAETIRAFNRPFVNPWSMEGLVSYNRRPIPDVTLTQTLVKTKEEPQVRRDSVRVEYDDCLPLEKGLYWLTQFDIFVTDDGLRRYCRNLFADGYYSLAVQKAYIYIDNFVSKRSGRTDKDGADLMRTVFSPKNPVLKLNKLESRSEENQQQGYMHIFEGTMMGIRNPRAHEHDIEDSPREAFEMLVIANHLMRMLRRAALS